MFSMRADASVVRQSASVVVVLITVNKQILPDASEKLIELFMESFVCGERGETTERQIVGKRCSRKPWTPPRSSS